MRLLFTILFCLLTSAITLQAQSVVTISSNITTNTTWTSNNIYLLSGPSFIYVTNNATLTIEAGTLIKGNPSALVITRGAKIIADGTKTRPIVFTSSQPAGQRAAGDWGGLALLGRAPINVPGGESTLEGGLDPDLGKYGGGATPDPNDNSGVLRYVRIEFAGIAFQPNNEINSLTMGGVGAGTLIDHVQTSFGGDDAFEWFGGTVNGKFLVAYKTVDDIFDTDFGYVGKNQFVLGISDPNVADISGSNGFESDNDGTGTTNTPLTDPKFVNLSIFGPLQTPNTTINSNFRRGAHLRRSTSLDIYNSAIVGFPTALRLESSNSVNAFLNGDLDLSANIWSGTIDSTTTTYQDVLTQLNASNNTVVNGPADLLVANPYSTSNPDFRPQPGSPLLGGADAGIYSDPFYTSATYRGAFGPNSDWEKCWTEWDPENADYSTAPVDYVAAYSAFTSQVNNNIVSFAAPAGAGLAYAWDFGDFTTSTQANPQHVYQALGTYNVSLLITTARGCSKTIAGTVTITSGTPEIAVNGDITTNTTWTSNNIYRLTGAACIYVRNNSTLTIQPGTIIKGAPSALVITRGSKIIADGTAEQPIVFTSAQPAGQRAAGDWGGLIILGNAPINTPGGTSVVEGGCDPTLATYGGTNAADNSGILRYVRVEFAGIAFQPNNELNSFTFGGVGSGTVIEHVQSSFGGDDALEWFGGTVNGKWVIAYKTVDDMFDTDFGYQGKNQFVLGISDPNIADISGSNGFESDNDGTGTTNTPLTDPKFVNLSIFGPKQTANTTINSNFRRGAHIRRSSSHDIYNSAIVGFPTALRLESSNSITAFLNGDLDLSANIWSGTIDSTSTNYQAVLTQLTASNNTLVSGPADLLVGDPYTIDNPDFRPQAGSPLLSGADASIYADNFFTTVDYRGAFGPDSNWEKCWTEWDPNNADYSISPLNYFTNRPDAFNFSQSGGLVVFAAPAGDFSYNWDFGLPGDGDVSTVANPIFTYEESGQFTVTLTVTNGRGCSTEITETLDIVTGVKDIEGLSYMNVFPNPTSGDATLDFYLNESLYGEVAMFDITGRLVFRLDQQFELGQNQLTLPTNNVANGIYMIRLMAENGVKTLKLRVSK